MATYSYMFTFPTWSIQLSDRSEVLMEQRVAQTMLKKDYEVSTNISKNGTRLEFFRAGVTTRYSLVSGVLMRESPVGSTPRPVARHVLSFDVIAPGPTYAIDVCLVFQKRRFRRRCLISSRNLD